MIACASAPVARAGFGRPVWGALSPSVRPDSRLALLKQRLAATPPWERPIELPPQPGPAAEPKQPPLAPQAKALLELHERRRQEQQQQQRHGEAFMFVTDQEQAAFSGSQLQFLERKRRAAAGLGPIMPESCSCQACVGSGTTVCTQCGGTGVNARDKAEAIFQNERGEIRQNSGGGTMQLFFRQDSPCWLCRGNATIACADCGGSGLQGLDDYVAD